MATVIDMDLKKDVKYGLQALADTQKIVSGMVKGAITEDSPTKDQLCVYFLALIRELTELLNELNWKPWKNEFTPNAPKVIDEFADILAFQGLIIVYLEKLGISQTDLANGYAMKTRVNIERFRGEHPGYEINRRT